MASFVMHEARSTCDSSVNRMKTPCIRVQMSLLTRKSPPMIRSALLVRVNSVMPLRPNMALDRGVIRSRSVRSSSASNVPCISRYLVTMHERLRSSPRTVMPPGHMTSPCTMILPVKSRAEQRRSPPTCSSPCPLILLTCMSPRQTRRPSQCTFPPSSPIASNEPRARKPSNRMPASQEQLPFAVTF